MTSLNYLYAPINLPSCLLPSGGFPLFAKFTREVDLLIALVELMCYISHGEAPSYDGGIPPNPPTL